MLPTHDSDDDDVTASQLSQRSRYLSLTLNRSWKHWKNEYLLDLREAHHHRGGLMMLGYLFVR